MPESLVTADPGLATVPPGTALPCRPKSRSRDSEAKSRRRGRTATRRAGRLNPSPKHCWRLKHPGTPPRPSDKFDTQIVKLLNERTKHVLASVR